jgi:hypothetical protein
MEIWEKPFERSEYVGRAVATDEVIGQLYDAHIKHGCHQEHALRYLREGRLPLWSNVQFSGSRRGAPYEHCEPAIWMELNHYDKYNKYGPFVFQLPKQVLCDRTFMVLRRDDKKRPRFCFVEVASRSPLRRLLDNDDEVWARAFRVEDHELKRFSTGIYHFVLTTPALVSTGSRIVSARHPSCGRCAGYSPKTASHSLGSLVQAIEDGTGDYSIQDDGGPDARPRIVALHRAAAA